MGIFGRGTEAKKEPEEKKEDAQAVIEEDVEEKEEVKPFT